MRNKKLGRLIIYFSLAHLCQKDVKVIIKEDLEEELTKIQWLVKSSAPKWLKLDFIVSKPLRSDL